MQRLIAFLLHKFTPYRVVCWWGGKIAGIGIPDREHIAEVDRILAQQLYEKFVGKCEKEKFNAPVSIPRS